MGVDKPAAKSLAARSPNPKPQKMVREIPKARVAESESGISTTTIAALLVGVVVLAGGAFFWRRRSMGGSDADEGQDVGGVGNNPFSGFASSDGDQPALSLGGGGGLRGASEFETGGIEEDPDAKEESAPAPHTEMTSLEMDAEQTLVSGMSQSNTQLTGGSQGVQGSMNVTPEFEQRMAGLESRLKDVSEARERLERQVAAQTEELRVQRAAIARTQRAVRNTSRGDDDGPTEPTPRDSQ
jgi:hypothetical protein